MTVYELDKIFDCKKCNKKTTTVILERTLAKVCDKCDKKKSFYYCLSCEIRVKTGSILKSFVDKYCPRCRIKCKNCNLTMSSADYGRHDCEINFCEVCEETFIGSKQWFEIHKYNHEKEEELELEEDITIIKEEKEISSSDEEEELEVRVEHPSKNSYEW